MEYLNIGTRGVRVSALTTGVGGMRSGIEILPSTPAWSRNNMGIVWVGYSWAVRPCGSQMARRSMHVACSGLYGGGECGVQRSFPSGVRQFSDVVVFGGEAGTVGVEVSP